MARVDVVMPKMGESIMEGTIIEWSKSVGDTVELDETLLEIATDKVDSEVPSPAAGVLVEIKAQANDTVEVGQVIAVIETDASAARVTPDAGRATPEASPSPTPEAPATVAEVAPPTTTNDRFYSPSCCPSPRRRASPAASWIP